MQQYFDYTEEIIGILEVHLSPERLNLYYETANGDKQKGLTGYVWNAQLAESFHMPLGVLEVLLRNALHARLTLGYGENWFVDLSVGLDLYAQTEVKKAEKKLRDRRKPRSSGRMIAELSFGFWISLLNRQYEDPLWRYYLHKAFPHAPKPLLRKTASKKLQSIRDLRNRIAHHEPIFTRDLQADYEAIVDVVRWIHPEIEEWMEKNSRFSQVLRENPFNSAP